LITNWHPVTLALTHLGTLGFLAMVMLGALYQLTPVVAGSRVRGVRSAHVVWLLLTGGLVGLVFGLVTGASRVTFVSMAVLALSLLIFLPTVGLALLRAPTRNETVTGMRLALGALFLVAFLGLWMAHGHIGMEFPGPRNLWVQAHLSVGFLGWVGGLISAVSWQVLPMFYMAAEYSRRSKRTILVLVAVGVLLPVIVVFAELAGLLPASAPAPNQLAALGAAPAAFAVLCLQPALALRGLTGHRRRRRRLDTSLRFWQMGLSMAFATAAAAAAAHFLPHPRWALLFGWLAIWGWAGMIVHGMLTRIVPFLVWLHRFMPLVGHAPVPSLRSLLPDRWTRVGLALHAASVLFGIAAIATGSDWLARATGLLLIGTALQLEHSLVHVLRQRVPDEAPAAG
jgi:hypothetical protein